jgi:DEAD/DEAH box helicase domain-containing protein
MAAERLKRAGFTMDTKTEALSTAQGLSLAPVELVLKEIADRFRYGAKGGIAAIKRFPAREAQNAPFPPGLHPRLIEVLKARGINELYTHQAKSFTLAQEGKNLVVVTPTASGKTLCYNLPIINELLANPESRALYLFPTKALSQDQLVELMRWSEQLGEDIRTFTYDGDTPQDARKAIRARGNLVITNPDMLHAGILPHHTKWQRLFENLKYIVIDELHYYRGVLGSHLANVLRRLKRVSAFFGTSPQFICTSATIANPQHLAARILEEDVTLIEENGAPSAEKYFVCYNPPVVNPQLGIRRSYLNETRRLAKMFLGRGLQTIIFANSRLATEILVTYLQEDFAPGPAMPQAVRGYRGGYLPLERREIERDLRSGRLRGVVSTNALELGIDVGSLDVALLASYPGTIASTWQRAGRAGRRQGTSAVVLVASSAPLDQFMVQNPEYFFGRSPEHGYVNPDNLLILLNHLKCAAFELPLREDEKFGGLDLPRLCKHLEETGFLHHTKDGWHWLSESYPADAFSLRSISSDNFVIVDNTREPRVIGETDFTSALTTLHEKAIYIQDGVQYHVERLDYDDRKAYVHEVESEYFTDAISYTKIQILETFDSAPAGEARKNHGEVQVNTQVVGFKKIKFHTMENVGSGELALPEQEMHTTAFWLTLPRTMMESLPYNSEERIDGVNGLANALGAIATLLVMCDARDLGTSVGENAELELVAEADVTIAQDLSPAPTANGTQGDAVPEGGATSELSRPLPGARVVVKKIFEPNIYLYDSYPGGVGLSEPLFRMSESLLEKTHKLISECPCPTGCPSCVGPAGEIGEKGKEVALEILRRMTFDIP